MKPTIGILLDSIEGKTTGIGTYAKSLWNAARQSRLAQFTPITHQTHANPFPVYSTYSWHNWLPVVLGNNRYDFLFNPTGVPHLIGYRTKELFFVYDISWYLFPQWHPPARVLLYRLLFPATLRHSHTIVVDSLHTKQDLIRHFRVPEQKVFVLYPSYVPPETEPVKPALPVSGRYMLFIGTVEPRKNIPGLIAAFERQTAVPHLILVGKPGWNMHGQIPDSPRIHRLGYVTDAEKLYLFRHAVGLVYPSFYEGFGLPVLEALANGCPVITSTRSSIPEVIGNAGIRVNPTDIPAITDAIRLLATDEALRSSYIREGYRRAALFTGDMQIRQLDNLIRQLWNKQ